MANYAVFLQGENFELPRDGGKQLLGFFVTVRVEAESEAEAGSKAIQLVKSDSQLEDSFKADAAVSSDLRVKLLHQLLPENRMDRTEYTFYPMGEE